MPRKSEFSPHLSIDRLSKAPRIDSVGLPIVCLAKNDRDDDAEDDDYDDNTDDDVDDGDDDNDDDDDDDDNDDDEDGWLGCQ